MDTYNLDIRDIFRNSLNQKVSKPFLIKGKQQLTYDGLRSKIAKLSTYFANSGISIGDRVLVSSKNEEFVCYFYLALLANGITVVFIDSDSSRERATSIISFCQPKLVFIDEVLIDKWQTNGIENLKIVPIVFKQKASAIQIFLKKNKIAETSFPACIEVLQETVPDLSIDPELDAYILFTSGTTSAPKGVRISFRALFSHLQTLVNVYKIDENSRIFNNLILSHADGMIQGPVLAFFSKSTVYRPFPFSIQRVEESFDTIYQDKISHWVMVPTMISIINQLKGKDKDTLETSDFKYVVSCGGKLEPKLWEEFEKKFKTIIINGFGLTETVAGGLFAGPDEKTHLIGTIGAPVDCQAIIVDENGQELPIGETGEIWLKGSLLMSGYLNAPDLNNEVFSDGWLKTGDLGYKGVDGCFRIVGRKKSVIITGGYNINPDEITEVLNSHQAVFEAVTFGLENETWGETANSAIVLKSGYSLKEEDFIKHCRQHLEERKIPSKIYFLNELPYGRSGKVNLVEIKNLVLNQHQESNHNQEFKTIFVEIVSKCLQLPVNEINMDISTENTPAWDSMSHLMMIAEFEKQFNIEFSPIEVMDIDLLSDLSKVLKQKLN